MNYWLDLDIWRNRVDRTETSFDYGMIDQKEDGTSYPNIKKINKGDKVIFVNSLSCYANGIIKEIHFDPYVIG